MNEQKVSALNPNELTGDLYKDKENLPVIMAIYKEAHETRRSWERYIWQYGVLLTVLAAIFIKWAEPTLVNGGFTIVQKIVLSIVTLFVCSIFANVYRARGLLKEIEKSISKLHVKLGNDIPIVPAELNSNMSSINRISSTRIALFAHLCSVLIFVGLTLYGWLFL